MPRPRRRTLALAPASALAGTAHEPLDPEDVPDPHLRVYSRDDALSSINALEAAVGGRQRLVDELLASPDLTPPMRKVLVLIMDQRFNKYSLGFLCAKSGIGLGEVLQSFRDARLGKANLLAICAMADAIPSVTREFLKYADEHDETCTHCRGVGVILPKAKPKPGTWKKAAEDLVAPDTCPTCAGTGIIRVPGDLDRQKTLFEMAGLLKKSGLVVQQNTQINQPAADPSQGLGGLEQLQQAVSHILYGAHAAPILDVTPVVADDLGQMSVAEGAVSSEDQAALR